MYKTLHREIYKDMEVVVCRMEQGHLCGYVGINNNHMLYGLDYLTKLTPEGIFDINQPVGDRGVINLLFMANKIDKYVTIGDLFDVHGSITYSSCRKGWETYPTLSDSWFFGFDCAHYGDDEENWNLERVIEETKRLADQLYERKDIEVRLYTEIEKE